MLKSSIPASAFFVLMFTSGAAAAGSVYLNGVDITSVRDKTFKNATVRIDDNGDIHIDAPGYKVEVVDTQKKAAEKAAKKEDPGGPNPALANHYYLVTQPSAGGKAQYDFVVTVNGVEKKLIPAGSPQVILEISAWLDPGPNEVRLIGRKNVGEGRKSDSEAHEARLIIGRGHVEDKIVKIDSILASLKVDASSTNSREKALTLRAE